MYKYYEQEIYYRNINSLDSNPKAVIIDGQEYIRFMDFIYLPCEPEFLSEAQVFSLNKLRDDFYDELDSIEINLKLKDFVSRIINSLLVSKVVEYGCGYRTIKNTLNSEIEYVGIDIDPSVILSNKRKNINCILMSNDLLELKTGFAELIASIFVFHFNITQHQISEIRRVLASDGIVISNVYRLSKKSRRMLIDRFESFGFGVITFKKEDDFCKSNEYWCIYRDQNSKILNSFLRIADDENLDSTYSSNGRFC